MIEHLHFLSALVATIVGMAVGALWYSPLLAGKAWLKEMGKPMEDLGDPKTSMAMSTVNMFIVALFLQIFMGETNTQGALAGAGLAIVIWLGFVATTQVLAVFFQGHTWRHFFIDTGNQFFCYLVMGAILGAWQ